MSNPPVRVTERGAVQVWVLGDGHRNTLTLETVDALARCLAEVRGRPEVRAVVLTGEGDRAFVAGADLKQRLHMGREEILGFLEALGSLFLSLERAPQLFISALNGHALGGGLELALSTDVRWAASHCKVGLPEVGLAIIPGAGGTQRLPRLVGYCRGKSLILTGRAIEAGQALELGILDKVLDKQRLVEDAVAFASEVASLPQREFEEELRRWRERKQRGVRSGEGPTTVAVGAPAPAFVELERSDGIVVGALSPKPRGSTRPLRQWLGEISASPEVKAVVLRTRDGENAGGPWNFGELEQCDKIFIAALDGSSMDSALAQAADMALASPRAHLAAGVEEALRRGRVDQMVSEHGLLEAALKRANEVASKGPLAVAAAKAAIRDGWHLPLVEALKLERRYYESRVLDSNDRLEGLKAFVEKRPPVYEGR